MKSREKKDRIIARGEHSNHCHVIVGNAEIKRENGRVLITVDTDGDAVLKHLLETEWVNGNEVWTKEHHDIPLKRGTYEYIQQEEYDPFEDIIREVYD